MDVSSFMHLISLVFTGFTTVGKKPHPVTALFYLPPF